MIAEMRLQWWRDRSRCWQATGRSARMRWWGRWLRVVRGRGCRWRVMDRLIEARRWDIYRDGFEDQAAMDAYLEDTGAGLMWLACSRSGRRSAGGAGRARCGLGCGAGCVPAGGAGTGGAGPRAAGRRAGRGGVGVGATRVAAAVAGACRALAGCCGCPARPFGGMADASDTGAGGCRARASRRW